LLSCLIKNYTDPQKSILCWSGDPAILMHKILIYKNDSFFSIFDSFFRSWKFSLDGPILMSDSYQRLKIHSWISIPAHDTFFWAYIIILYTCVHVCIFKYIYICISMHDISICIIDLVTRNFYNKDIAIEHFNYWKKKE